MMFTPFWIALALVAVPPQTASAPADSAARAKPDPMQKRVCRSDTATGSHMSKKICHTKAEWVQADAASRRNAPGAGIAGMQSEPFAPR